MLSRTVFAEHSSHSFCFHFCQFPFEPIYFHGMSRAWVLAGIRYSLHIPSTSGWEKGGATHTNKSQRIYFYHIKWCTLYAMVAAGFFAQWTFIRMLSDMSISFDNFIILSWIWRWWILSMACFFLVYLHLFNANCMFSFNLVISQMKWRHNENNRPWAGN